MREITSDGWDGFSTGSKRYVFSSEHEAVAKSGQTIRALVRVLLCQTERLEKLDPAQAYRDSIDRHVAEAMKVARGIESRHAGRG
jgi:hypothetical protein